MHLPRGGGGGGGGLVFSLTYFESQLKERKGRGGGGGGRGVFFVLEEEGGDVRMGGATSIAVSVRVSCLSSRCVCEREPKRKKQPSQKRKRERRSSKCSALGGWVGELE